MPINVDINQSGAGPFVFGFAAADAPTITGFFARSVASADREPEAFAVATNGEGFVEAVAIAKPSGKMLKFQFTGYVTTAFDPSTLGNTFSFMGRFFFIKKISDPTPKGQFKEVSIDAESYPLVSS